MLRRLRQHSPRGGRLCFSDKGLYLLWYKKSPLSLNMTPSVKPSSQVLERIYLGIGFRLIARFLDIVLLVFFLLVQLLVAELGRGMYLIFLAPAFLFQVFFYVYCVKRWGGTPGKLILGLKVVKDNGENVGWKEATIRESVTLAFSLATLCVTAVALRDIPEDSYGMAGFLEKKAILIEVFPLANALIQMLTSLWSNCESLVLICNRRRKAIHDYMAGTLVIRRKDQVILRNGLVGATLDIVI